MDHAQLVRMLEASGIGYILWSANNFETHLTDSLWRMLGYDPQGEAGSVSFQNASANARDLVHPDDRSYITRELASVLTSPKTYQLECRLLHAGGHYRWVKIQGRAFDWDDTGMARQMVGSVFDIHELKLLQQETERRRQRADWLRSVSGQLFENGSEAVIRHSLRELCEQFGANRGYLRLRDQVTGLYSIAAEWHAGDLQPFLEVLPADYEALMQKQLGGILPRQGVLLRRNTDAHTGRQKHIRQLLGIEQAILIPLYHDQQVQGVLSVMSAQEQQWDEELLELAQELARILSLVIFRTTLVRDLEESRHRFQFAMEATQDGIWDIDLARDALYASQGYYQMIGRHQSEFPDGWQQCFEIVHPDDKERLRGQFLQFFASDVATLNCEFRLCHKNGSVVWVMARATKTEFDGQGNVTRVVGVNTNITEFKHALASLEQARIEASAASQAKSEFLARMSHEIRTPMNAIMGLSSLLLEGQLSQEQHSNVQHIDDAAGSLLRIIDDILDFSKIEAGKMRLDEERVDLSALVSGLSNMLALKAQQKGLALVFDIHPDVPEHIRGDRTRLQQVMLNLLSNAVKFTSRGGVYMTLQMGAAGELEIRVRDTGIGIAQEIQRQLFKPFAQGDGSVTRRFGGTGLGLVICKHLVELMGGVIELSSTLQEGSEFRVRLPVSCALTVRNDVAADARFTVVDEDGEHAVATLHLLQRMGSAGVRRRSLPELMTDPQQLAGEGSPHFLMVDDNCATPSQLEQLQQRLQVLQQPPQVVCVTQIHRVERLSAALPGVIFRTRPLTPEKLQSLLVRSVSPSVGVTLSHSDTRRLQGMRVLVVEDNVVNQKVALGMLARFGVEAEVAADGLLALEALNGAGHRFDAILMDMEMPNMDGYQATLCIREVPELQQLPIIAMTAHAMQGDRERCLAAGMNDYLSKPVTPASLCNALLAFVPDDCEPA
ncbi:PAS domain-containing protein [Pseudomaricurvus sp. HS19]|uniref:PAS domain-containing protein n=1 Tax=Pseudomaricurvus sp. HS19 TaxID=2692626 RepID=UPI0013709544|nr:PAS domain-containing protein [Pseudomaricurvus sp. HS19]MYM62069.1 PAS domain-containing protein [Pseudomaricurvus sp. HS19]